MEIERVCNTHHWYRLPLPDEWWSQSKHIKGRGVHFGSKSCNCTNCTRVLRWTWWYKNVHSRQSNRPRYIRRKMCRIALLGGLYYHSLLVIIHNCQCSPCLHTSVAGWKCLLLYTCSPYFSLVAKNILLMAAGHPFWTSLAKSGPCEQQSTSPTAM